jgi:hypothetical protein
MASRRACDAAERGEGVGVPWEVFSHFCIGLSSCSAVDARRLLGVDGLSPCEGEGDAIESSSSHSAIAGRIPPSREENEEAY